LVEIGDELEESADFPRPPETCSKASKKIQLQPAKPDNLDIIIIPSSFKKISLKPKFWTRKQICFRAPTILQLALSKSKLDQSPITILSILYIFTRTHCSRLHQTSVFFFYHCNEFIEKK